MKPSEWIDWRVMMRHMNGELTGQEAEDFDIWLRADRSHSDYYERMKEEWNQEDTHESDMPRLLTELDAFLVRHRMERHRTIRRRWMGWSAAAAVLFLVLGGAWTWSQWQESRLLEQQLATITPAESRATLIMHDGTQVELNKEVRESSLVQQLVKKDAGTVRFRQEEKQSAPGYNKVLTPKGGEYHIILSDGSEVWLNAESELKIPVYFKGTVRRVALTGEAYFKIAPDAKRPFVVETDLGRVRVYGTQFNVRCYPSEEQVKTTLVSGSVGFSTSGQIDEDYVRIEPGYQICREAQFDKPVVQQVKVNNVIAWKNRQFCFESQSLDEIMQEIGRWYNVSVTFKDESLKQLYFSATLDRYEGVRKLLRFFEEGSNLKFTVRGRNIIISEK